MWSVPHPGAHLALDEAGSPRWRGAQGRCGPRRTGPSWPSSGQPLRDGPDALRDGALPRRAGPPPEDCLRLSDALTRVYLAKLESGSARSGPTSTWCSSATTLGVSRPAPVPRDVPPGLRALPPSDVAAGQGAGRGQGAAPQLRGHRALPGRFRGDGAGRREPRPDVRRGMEAVALKARHGGRLCFWGGGCDTHRSCLRHARGGGGPRAEPGGVMARGSGFVFQQVHNVMADVPRRTWWPCTARRQGFGRGLRRAPVYWQAPASRRSMPTHSASALAVALAVLTSLSALAGGAAPPSPPRLPLRPEGGGDRRPRDGGARGRGGVERDPLPALRFRRGPRRGDRDAPRPRVGQMDGAYRVEGKTRTGVTSWSP